MRDRLLILLAPPLALVSPVLATMMSLSLPISSSGSLAVISAFASVGLLLGAAAAISHGRSRLWGIVEAGALATAALLLVDLMVGGHKLLEILATGKPAKTAFVAILGLALLGLFYLTRSRVAPVIFAGSAAMLASTLVVTPAYAKVSQRPLIYVVLDEMIGPEGIDRSLAGGPGTYQAVRDVFEKHGFRLYGRAFSRHYKSKRAIPATLNFDENDNAAGVVSKYSGETDIEFTRLALLSDRAEVGPVVIQQSAHLDWCPAVPSAECNTFNSFSVPQWVPSSNDGFWMGLRREIAMISPILRDAFRESYVGFRLFNQMHARLHVSEVEFPAFADIHAFHHWFGEFEEELLERDAQTYFGHFLMPHNPAVLNEACEPQNRWINPYNLTERLGLTGDALDAERAKLYGWYYEQVRCLTSELDELLTRLEQVPAYDDATIVFHGDHGSRISAGHLAETLSARDMVDNYSTLYAIKGPGVEPGYDGRIISIQRLTTEYFGGKTAAQLGQSNHTVAIDSEEDGKVVLRRMPDF